jgi:hypothetical protein
MSAEFSCRELGPADHSAWESFVIGSTSGSPYSLPVYLEALCEATGGRYRVLACERDGQILGGIALFERSSWAGPYATPRLLLYYNGFVLAEGDSRYPSQRTSQQLKVLDSLAEAIESLGHAAVRLHSRESLHDARALIARGWKAHPSYSYVLSLENPREAYQRVEGNFRRLIRRCESEGMQLTRDEDFDAFFALHHEVHDRKGVKLYLPREKFRSFYERLHAAGMARIYHARDGEGRALASQLVLASAHPVAHTVCAGSAADAMRSGASVFLRWKAAEDLAREGHAANDLTDAELNPVTRFKSQLGGQLACSLMLESPQSLAWRVRARAERWVSLPSRATAALKRRLSS